MRVLWLLAFLILMPISSAETTCSVNGCEITITIKIAFSGANDSYINDAENQIESVWNGPNGYRTTGDCNCKMKFEVETMKITNASQANCNPGPPGYHCVMVTDYNNNPPRNQTNMTGATYYAGYMYGVASGNGSNSQNGWWSDIMGRPVNEPEGERYKDFAHEAGHMMGLEDGDGGIMSDTSGANSGPTQANIDEIANDICGSNPCPDKCCCGDGEVNKGEECDPFATPTGCKSGESCCAAGCHCYISLCIPADGEYYSQSDCQNACGSDSGCYKNYQTGCWDCVKQEVVVEDLCRDPDNVRGNEDCEHVERSFINQGVSFYETDLVSTPVIGGIFSDERINVKTDDGSGHIITEQNSISDYDNELLDDPSVTIFTDSETMRLIASEDMSVQQALSAGRIEIQGEGLFNGFRFGVYHFLFDVYNFVSPAPEFEMPEIEEEFPEYSIEQETGEAGEYNPEDLPDGGYIGGDVFPY
jgi:hypothetical protein